MNYSPEICIETLGFLNDHLHSSYPRVVAIIKEGVKSIGNSSQPYDTFKQYLTRVSNIVGFKTIQMLLMRPKAQMKRDLCLYIHGSPHIDKCCDAKCARRECKIARDMRVHIDKKTNGQLDCGKLCSTCSLLKEVSKYQMKKVILNARFGIGETGCVDLVDHAIRCDSSGCQQRFKSYTCLEVKRFLDHEKDCVDVDCSCFYIEPLLRYAKRERDDMPRLDSFDELTDLVVLSGFDEEELRKEMMVMPSKSTQKRGRRVIKRPRVLTKEEQYVNSFGLSGGIYDD